ncbi:hypothetical protein [Mycobacterium colombiense]|uniref:hypothetical protein n=1 Tax=Mycobacterium colombiense TaxID=339268 RepID=UPI00200A0855|nr:hypothetical protein [Mycobacterium colombiense]MCK8645639.1 hypothetical protein [Mycobacterium colombiense]
MVHDNTSHDDTAQTADQSAAEDAALQQESDGQEPRENEPGSRNAEAARQRHRAKAAEDGLSAARLVLDGYEAQVNALQKQIVDQHVIAQFASPDDFHRNANLADLLDEAGSVDFAKVDTAAQQILTANPHYRRGAFMPAAAPATVVNSDKPTTFVPGGQKPSWSDVFEQGKKM